MFNEGIDANQSLDNQPSIPLYDRGEDKYVSEPAIPSQSQPKEKGWLARICPLFSIAYVGQLME